MENVKEKAEAQRVEKLVAEIRADFERRRQERRMLERGWELNMNFFSGNQYCDVTDEGELTEEESRFYWQSRRVFNHIAPAVDMRCAVLEKNRPTLKICAFSNEEGDVQRAAMASGILRAAAEKIGLNEVFSRATLWSEVCGTAFYKVVWSGGSDGDVQVLPLSPFEIFPDNLAAEREEDVHSLIHARAVSVREIAETYDVELPSRPIDGFASMPYSAASHWLVREGQGNGVAPDGYEILIERYTMPEANAPEGRLEIVAGDRLLYEGVLPYKNREGGERGFPFVRQRSIPLPGAYFGASVVDRLIPLQRAYNAVRNRKHEFLNRLSMGVLAVEDGAVDVDELAEDGLCPGKIVVYRQGSTPPEMLKTDGLPSDFHAEEERIIEEFDLISGMNDMKDQNRFSGVTSATGLQLLMTREEERLSFSAKNIARAAEEVARKILRMYKQFASTPRIARMSGENRKTEVFYFNAGDISAEHLIFDGESESTVETRRRNVAELLAMGVLTDKNGVLAQETKEKVAAIFGVEDLVTKRDATAMHIARADRENLALREGKAVQVESYDEHETHVLEHLRFLLSDEISEKGSEQLKAALKAHIEEHKKKEGGNEK